MSHTSEDVAKILLKLKAVTLNPKKHYKFASGILSPVYTDCRVLIAYPEKRREIRDFYIEAIKSSGVSYDLIAGTATAGIPHAAWIADELGIPMVYVRGKAKDHGKENLVEGIIEKGQKAIVIEDLVSTGESSINSVNAIRAAGGEVTHVFAIITYGIQKAQDNFNASNLSLITLTTFREVVKEAQEMGYIEEDEVSIILDWIADPSSWGKSEDYNV
jgi:orotate phosphoribosyltransferase